MVIPNTGGDPELSREEAAEMARIEAEAARQERVEVVVERRPEPEPEPPAS